MEKVWLMDFGAGAEKAFASLETAYNAAYDKLVEWGYSPDDEDEKNFFEELKETYENNTYSGFCVDELLWCWEVPFDGAVG